MALAHEALLHKNLSFIAAATVAAKRGTWRCPRCDDVCPCNKCVQRRSKDGRQRRGKNQPREGTSGFEFGKGIEDLHISGSSLADDDCTPGASHTAKATSSIPQDDEAYEGALGLCAILKKEEEEEDSHSNSPSKSSDALTPPQQQNSGTSQDPRLSASDDQPAVNSSEGKEEHLSPTELPWTPRKSRSACKRDSTTARTEEVLQECHSQALSRRGKMKDVHTVPHQAEENLELPSRRKLPRYSVDEEQQPTFLHDSHLPFPGIRGSRSFTYQMHDNTLGCRSNIGHKDGQLKPGLRLSGSADAFQYVMGGDVSTSPATERIFSAGRLQDSISPRSASLPHTPVRRKLSRKGIPSRGDSGIDFSPLIEPSSPCKAVSPCVLPRTAAEPPVNNQHRMSVTAAGLESDEHCASEVSIEKLETLRPGSSKEDDATSPFAKDVQKRLSEDCNALTSPGTPREVKAEPYGVSAGPSTSRLATLGTHDRMRSDKKVAAAVAAALRLCVPEIAGSGTSFKTSSSSSDCSEGRCDANLSTEESPPGKENNTTSDLALRCDMKLPRGTEARKQEISSASPYNLIQEGLTNDPWKLLVASMLLEDHPSHMVRLGVRRLFQDLPSADDVLSSDMQTLEQFVCSAGFHERWAKNLFIFTREFSSGNWAQITDLPGVGRYVADAYAIFIEGRLQSAHPTDSLLLKYQRWALCHK
ncbi:unnamed protein product [Closterium sp. Yama58-4]|nr:unnamed protein product [Closterium sp. Yama58-4]